MRADEAINEDLYSYEFIEGGVLEYINQLRVERLMAKAEFFKNDCLELWCNSSSKKNLELYEDQFHRIAEALEARARRIKESM